MSGPSPDEIADFIKRGYLRVADAFSPQLAEDCRELMWRDLPGRADRPETWTQPVVWLPGYSSEPFLSTAHNPRLAAAYDALVGEGAWLPPRYIGAIPVRFPTGDDTGDLGWHVDAAFPGPDSAPTDYLSWRVNIRARGRALLLLILFSDVGEDDAPTRLRAGSHRDVARLIAPAGEAGLRPADLELSKTGEGLALATGPAGTVYLCHPFLVHAAGLNKGARPRFMAQPALVGRKPFDLDAASPAPVERAVIDALRA